MSPSRIPITVLTSAVGERLGSPITPDDWRPAVQGAVGQVLGVRDGRGTPYVVKTFGPDAGRRAATEVRALRLLHDRAGVPVADVVAEGELPDNLGWYVLLTRLSGTRWSDRRDDLSADQLAGLHRDVADLLRRVHEISGDRFGDLLDDGPSWPTAWENAAARCDRTMAEYLAYGGSPDLAERLRHFVAARERAFDNVRPVLCHHDVNGGNLFVAPAGPPTITGLVDLERASWDDPLADLALTWMHLWWHHPELVEAFVDAYGVRGDDERQRLDVHRTLRAMAEWSWVVQDQPPGWASSAATLGDLLSSSLQRLH